MSVIINKIDNLCLQGPIGAVIPERKIEFVTSESEYLFYKSDQYPCSCIGPVTICEIPKCTSNNLMVRALATFICISSILSFHMIQASEFARIWLWMHPSIFKDVFNELLQFSERAKNTYPPCVWEMTTTVTPVDRFRLRGPASAVFLRNLLGCDAVPVDGANFAPLSFFKKATDSPHLSAIWPAGAVLGCRFRDPRWRSQSSCIVSPREEPVPKKSTEHIHWPSTGSSSSLWDTPIVPFQTDLAVNTQKGAHMTESWRQNFAERDSSKIVQSRLTQSSLSAPFSMVESSTDLVYECPALLIRTQQALSKRLMKGRSAASLMSGWDIIVPAVWGSTVWKELQRPWIACKGASTG